MACAFPSCRCRRLCTGAWRTSIEIKPPEIPAHIPSSSLREYQGKPCPYCMRAMDLFTPRAPTRDHVVPISRGGKNYGTNVIIVCRACNHHKANVPLDVWGHKLRQKGDPRAGHVLAFIKSRKAKEDACASSIAS